MITNKPTPTRQLTVLPNGAETESLDAKTGKIRGWGVKLATSKAAAAARRDIELFKVEHEAGIAKTAIEISARQIRATLVEAGVSALGATEVSLNNKMATVDMALTNGATGEVVCHIDNRHRNFALADQLLAAGKIDEQEHGVLRSFVEADAATDIEASRTRMTDAKASMKTLHGFALNHIEKLKASLD
ncbi:MAG TPA: hypothetical protein VHU23_01645 [Rhizomicrobium sp.]|jgi:hypothetical protein|nr:hypothetical protein [Rhizomicrobium sp.]